MKRFGFVVLLLTLLWSAFGCGGDVSQAQADDRAKQMQEARNRPEEQGTQE